MNIFLNKSEFINSLYIFTGSLLVSLSIVLFFIPLEFTTGGTPGAAILLSHLSGFSEGTMVLAINIPLLIWGAKYLGRIFAIKTVITVLLISFFIDLFNHFLNIDLLISNILVAGIFGGFIIGIGVGLIIKGNSSAGGATIIARVLALKFYIKPAQVILISDALIVASSIFIYKDFEKAVISIISIVSTAKAIDIVLTGTLSTKVIHISSSKALELGEKINRELKVEGSILKGLSLNGKEDKTVILLVLDIKKLNDLKQIIEKTDKDAFMIVMEASEMLGRGH